MTSWELIQPFIIFVSLLNLSQLLEEQILPFMRTPPTRILMSMEANRQSQNVPIYLNEMSQEERPMFSHYNVVQVLYSVILSIKTDWQDLLL